MRVTLKTLSNGTYVVAWRTLSTVDGPLIRGSYLFSVGDPIQRLERPAEVSRESSPVEAPLHWLLLIGAVLMVGVPVHFVAVSGLRTVEVPSTRVSGFVWAGAGSLILAQLGLLLIQAATLAEGGLFDWIGTGIPQAFRLGLWGRLWTSRLILLAAWIAIALAAVRGTDRRARWAWIGAAVVGADVLLTISLGSHSAALLDFSIRGAAVDFGHLLAAAVWAGGLPALLFTIQGARQINSLDERRQAIARIVERFSVLATASVAVIIVTGLLGAWLHVVEPGRLLSTVYGRTLLVKVALVVPLLVLGAVNLTWVRRRLRTPAVKELGGSSAWLIRIVRVEAVLVVGVLLASGYLTAFEPGRQAALPGDELVQAVAAADDLRLKFRIRPGAPGPNRLEVTADSRRGPLPPDSSVQLTLKFLDRDIGSEQIALESATEGVFTVESDAIGIAGRWLAGFLVQRPGDFDARTAIRFKIAPIAGSPSSVQPDPVQRDIFFAVALTAIGVAIAAIGMGHRGFTRIASLRVAGGGVIGAAIGLAILFSAILSVGPAVPDINPILPDLESIAAGRLRFDENCAGCHGSGGRGDGPLASQLDPPPLDLAVHVPLHPDGVLFSFIKWGIEGTAMASFAEQFEDEQIWHLVNFIQTIPP
jgi:copper transport protein